jgi:hypothetical protein
MEDEVKILQACKEKPKLQKVHHFIALTIPSPQVDYKYRSLLHWCYLSI